MNLGELRNITILILVLTPFIALLSIYSFKYHVAFYEASPKDVRLFLEKLRLPLKLFFSWNNYGMYYDREKYSPQQIVSALHYQRILISVVPIMFVLMSIVVIIRLLPTGDPLLIRYMLILVILPYCIIRAWRFGRLLGSPTQ